LAGKFAGFSYQVHAPFMLIEQGQRRGRGPLKEFTFKVGDLVLVYFKQEMHSVFIARVSRLCAREITPSDEEEGTKPRIGSLILHANFLGL
jgi:hypothetical protein